MAKAGQEIDNPVTHERVIWQKTMADTHGAYVRFDQYLGTGGGRSSEHLHQTQDERYEIVSGIGTYSINGEPRTAHAGEVVLIARNTPHTNPYNTNAEELHVVREVRPGDGVDIFYETIYGLARDGKVGKDGFPNPLQMIVLGNGIAATTFFMPRSIPIPVQRVVLPILAFFGRLLGYRARYNKYSGPNAG